MVKVRTDEKDERPALVLVRSLAWDDDIVIVIVIVKW